MKSRATPGKGPALSRYARNLKLQVGEMVGADFDACRDAGCDDGEILEVKQLCAHFNYSSRLPNGLGVTTGGDTIGYYKEPGAT